MKKKNKYEKMAEDFFHTSSYELPIFIKELSILLQYIENKSISNKKKKQKK